MENMEESKMTAEEEIENEAEESNEDTLTEENEDQSSESTEEFLQRMLAKNLITRREYDNEWTASQLLATVLFMLAQNEPVSVPAKLEFGDDGKPAVKPVALKDDEDDLFLAIQTVPDDNFDVTVTMKIRKLFATVNKDEKLAGIAINPFSDNVLIPRIFVIAAMHIFEEAACEAEEDFKKQENSFEESPENAGVSCSYTVTLPMTENSFAAVESALKAMKKRPLEHVQVEFRNSYADEKILFLQTYRADEEKDSCHTEIAFDMSEFDWDHPLILGRDDMQTEEVIDLFHQICVECIPTDEIGYVQNFRDLGFGEPSHSAASASD